MQGKYYTTTVKPNFDILGNVEVAVGDVLFDWTPFEIPKGTANLSGISAIIAGLNGADVAGTRDIELYFAKSVSGSAPPTLGDTGSAVTGIISQQSRPYIIDKAFLDGSGVRSSVHFISYNVWSYSGGSANDKEDIKTILNNEDNYPGTTPGYQTIWVAGLAETAVFDFGTDVLLNQAGNQAISTSSVDLVTDGTDPRLCFAAGDELVSFVAANGSSPKQIGKVVSMADNVSILVDAVAEAFNDDTEICNRNPLKLTLNMSY